MAALWTVHGDGKHVLPTEVVSPDERLAWPQTIGLGLQHVLAMFGATFLVPVLTGFPPTTTIFFSGIGTIGFILITRGRGQRMGLPSYLGSSFAFISPVILAEGGLAGGVGRNIPLALGGIFVCGAVFFIIGAFVNQFGSKAIEWLMPPAVTGAVVALIGLNLAPTAAGEFQAQALTAFVTLAAILLCTVLLRGFIGRISILLGVIIGCIVSIPQGQYDFKPFQAAAWIGLPTFHTPTFSGSAILVIVPVVLVLIAENTGHIKAVASMTGRNLDRSLGRGYMGDGIATMLAGLGGGSGTTTYAENIGVMAATKVYSTAAYVVAGLLRDLPWVHPQVRRAHLRPSGRGPRRSNDGPVRTDRRPRRPHLGREPRRLQEPGEPHARRDRPDHRRRELHLVLHRRWQLLRLQRDRDGLVHLHLRLPAHEVPRALRPLQPWRAR